MALLILTNQWSDMHRIISLRQLSEYGHKEKSVDSIEFFRHIPKDRQKLSKIRSDQYVMNKNLLIPKHRYHH